MKPWPESLARLEPANGIQAGRIDFIAMHLLLISVFTFCVAAGVAALVWDGLAIPGIPTLEQYWRWVSPEAYRSEYVVGLWTQDAADCLCGFRDSAEFVAIFRREVRRARRLALAELREESMALAAVASMVSDLPTARDINFTGDMARWRIRHRLRFALLFATSLPLLDRLPSKLVARVPAELVQDFEAMRLRTRALFAILSDRDMTDLKALILGPDV